MKRYLLILALCGSVQAQDARFYYLQALQQAESDRQELEEQVERMEAQQKRVMKQQERIEKEQEQQIRELQDEQQRLAIQQQRTMRLEKERAVDQIPRQQLY